MKAWSAQARRHCESSVSVWLACTGAAKYVSVLWMYYWFKPKGIYICILLYLVWLWYDGEFGNQGWMLLNVHYYYHSNATDTSRVVTKEVDGTFQCTGLVMWIFLMGIDMSSALMVDTVCRKIWVGRLNDQFRGRACQGKFS